MKARLELRHYETRKFGRMRLAKSKAGGYLVLFPHARNDEVWKLDPANWKAPQNLAPGGSTRIILKNGRDAGWASSARVIPDPHQTATAGIGTDVAKIYAAYPPRSRKPEKMTSLNARARLWLLRNGFDTAPPLAMHVSPDGRRTLIVRNLRNLKHANTQSALREIVKLEQAGAKPHDWAPGMNTAWHGQRICFIDTELFVVPDKNFMRHLRKIWREGVEDGRLF